MAQPLCLNVETAAGHHTIRCDSSNQTRPLTDLLRQHDLPLNTRCGQRGLCDGCLVELREGGLIHVPSGRRVQVTGVPVYLRGCEHCLDEGKGAAIRVPARSLLVYDPEVLTDFRINIPRALNPLWQLHPISATQLPSPDQRERWLQQELSNQGFGQRTIQISPQARQAVQTIDKANACYATVEFRSDSALVTDVLSNPPKAAWGVAVDVGTTTVVVLIVDLSTGRIISRAAGFNHQMTAGDNVLTRINLCLSDPAALGELQELLVQHTIARLVETALRQTGDASQAIVCYVMSGNTTMLHLLAGVDPSPMGMAPFTPRFLEHRVLNATAIRLANDNRSAAASEMTSPPVRAQSPEASASCQQTAPGDPAVHLLPGAAAYVGADLCAGVLSSGLRYDEGPSLLVDAGTNGEIILKSGDMLLGCATAAGPAFEGSGLTCGMRAGSGAISHLQLTTQPFQVSIDIIGKDGQKTATQKPQGICGSGYIDFLAEARRFGLLTPSGRLDEDCGVPDASDHLIRDEATGRAFVVGLGPGRRQIVVTETDISLLLQAKAAIAAGILTLLEKTNLSAAAVKTLYLAGGFGMQLDVANAIACGLLPGFVPEQVQLVGNTSLAGAYLALLDGSAVEELARIAKQLDVIELNLDPAFESRFIDQLALP